MKKILLFTCSFFVLATIQSFAQKKEKQSQTKAQSIDLTLGGNANNSVLSIMQIIDYPILKTNDNEIMINGFEFVITSEDGQKSLGPYISTSSKFAPEMIAALEEFKEGKSKIKLQHIMLFKQGQLIKEEALEYTIAP